MMEKNKKIEEEIEKTLDCFEQRPRLKTNPCFYARLKARMELQKRKEWKYVPIIFKPAFLLMILLLNAITIVSFFAGQSKPAGNRAQLLKAFAQEMTLDSNQISPNLFQYEQE
jgi:hypothetical protein